MPQETISESRARLQKMEEEDLARKREINARLRQQAMDAQDAQRKAPKVTQVEVEEEKTLAAPELSEEEEYKKNRPRYFKK